MAHFLVSLMFDTCLLWLADLRAHLMGSRVTTSETSAVSAVSEEAEKSRFSGGFC
jgi:hypothetical protein